MKKRHKRNSRRVRSTPYHSPKPHGGKDAHHFYHPKKLYSAEENHLMVGDYDFHHEYHNWFVHFCRKDPQGRMCHTMLCRFMEVCCYCGLTIEYGRRVF